MAMRLGRGWMLFSFVLLGILLLLSVALHNLRNLSLVLVNLPFSLVGGVLAVWLTRTLGESGEGGLTIGSLVVQAIRPYTKVPLDVHLMIEAPEKYTQQFAQAGANIITVHDIAHEDGIDFIVMDT
jgi:hypothetical protein